MLVIFNKIIIKNFPLSQGEIIGRCLNTIKNLDQPFFFSPKN